MVERKPSVLVLDDDPIVLAAVGERLSALGYTVHTRESVLGTSSWIVKNKPSLILLDLMMPALSGTDLADLLHRRGIDTPLILHSSKERTELQNLVKTTGALGAIPKGLSDEQFDRQFQALARSARATESLKALQQIS